MQLEYGHVISVIKWHNFIEFGLVWFVLTSTSVLDSHQGLMIKLENGHKYSVIKRPNSSSLLCGFDQLKLTLYFLETNNIYNLFLQYNTIQYTLLQN